MKYFINMIKDRKLICKLSVVSPISADSKYLHINLLLNNILNWINLCLFNWRNRKK